MLKYIEIRQTEHSVHLYDQNLNILLKLLNQLDLSGFTFFINLRMCCILKPRTENMIVKNSHIYGNNAKTVVQLCSSKQL